METTSTLAATSQPQTTLSTIDIDSGVQILFARLEIGVNLISEARSDFRPANKIAILLTHWHGLYQEYRAAVTALPAGLQTPWRYKGRNLKIMVTFDARPVADNTSERGAI